MIGQLFVYFYDRSAICLHKWSAVCLHLYIYLVPLWPSNEYLQFPTARTMNLDASDFLPQISFRIFEGKWMLLEIWMIIQFQVTAGAKCNKNRSGKNEDEKSYYSVRCNSKHVFFLIASQILKSSSNVWIPSDKNSFPFERKWLQYFPIFFGIITVFQNG